MLLSSFHLPFLFSHHLIAITSPTQQSYHPNQPIWCSSEMETMRSEKLNPFDLWLSSSVATISPHSPQYTKLKNLHNIFHITFSDVYLHLHPNGMKLYTNIIPLLSNDARSSTQLNYARISKGRTERHRFPLLVDDAVFCLWWASSTREFEIWELRKWYLKFGMEIDLIFSVNRKTLLLRPHIPHSHLLRQFGIHQRSILFLKLQMMLVGSTKWLSSF